ncbi:type II toxin-antitoxin system HicA family toxin [Desulfonatronum thioautotrophicum]|uniref:type II toxin-antitoxin system HicA family toxin n=1 Tax=Desulfonatronum thioautotrophicum TaxID=617001 RepID=UPI0005EB6FD6
MTRRFPIDAPIRKVVAALELLGFHIVREGNHIAMVRENLDGTRTPLTMPNHARLKGSTLRTILTQAGIPRDRFLDAFRDV